MTTATEDRATLAVIPKRGDAEQLRVTLSEYRGVNYCDVRVWFKTENGGWAPSKKGCTFGLDAIDAIMAALAKAKAMAVRTGR